MAAISPKQITILNALKSQLAGINGTGSYNTTVMKVTRNFVPVNRADTNAMPMIILEPIGSNFTYKTGGYKTSGNSLLDPEDGWQIALYCYINPELDPYDDAVLQDALIKFYADIELCIDSDPTISANVIQTRLISEQMQFDNDKSSGILLIMLSLKYDFDPGVDP